MTHEARRTSFERDAEAYDAARPSYPDEIVDGVLAHTGARRLLEVGAGTGKATRQFAARPGVSVVAVEPGAGLAAKLRANTAGLPVDVVEMRFEDFAARGEVPPGEEDFAAGGDFDLVYAAQAWHWMDPARKYEDAARAAPWLSILTNEKAPLDPALRAELDAAYRAHMPGAHPGSLAEARRMWPAEVAASGWFAVDRVLEHSWTERYSTRGYLDLIDTYSDHAVRANKGPLYAEIAAILERRGGAIEIPYVTLAVIARRIHAP